MGIRNILNNVFPSRLLASVFGIGFFPVWGNHWSAFLSSCLVPLLIYFTCGFDSSFVGVSIVLLGSSIIFLILSLFSIYLYLDGVNDPVEVEDQIVINIFTAQILVFALTVPATYYFYLWVYDTNTFMCTNFLLCSGWVFWCITYVPTASMPFFFYRIMDIIKPWPASFIELNCKNAFGKVSEAVINAIYATIAIYLVSFVFFNLPFTQFSLFFQGLSGVILNYWNLFFA